MNMDEIQTFLVLANCRNFTKSAEILHVVQSTVSNRIRALEEYVGVPLLLRYKNGVHLTMEGELFLSYASQIYALEQKSMQDIRMLNKFKDHLRIGCVRWIYDKWVEDMLLAFNSHFPDISLYIYIGHSKDMIPMLQNRLLDVAFISNEINNVNIMSIPFRKVKMILAGEVRKFGHLKEGIDKEDFLRIPLIYSDIWENYLDKISEHKLSGSMFFRVHSDMLDSAKAFCLAGAGCCLFPIPMLEKELAEGKMINIPVHNLPIQDEETYIAYQKQRLTSETLQNWINFYKDISDSI